MTFRRRSAQRGVTLIEMLVVAAIVGLLVGVSFPAITSGIDSLRISSATDSIVSFLDGALNRADRRQQVMELTVLRAENKMVLRTVDPTFVRELDMPDGVIITQVYPVIQGLPDDQPRRFLLYPGGTVPRIGIEVENRRRVKRIVRVDPITGVPQVERLEKAE